MCGIVGLVGTVAHNSAETCRRMVDSIRHRGPDSTGIFTSPDVILGHARLAILDLSEAAVQPMTAGSGRLTIVFNGEIYNHKELRLELEGLGWRFATNSDTEVILNAFEAWGENSVCRLNGIFAFAIYDNSRQVLYIARDRMGVKPLYWWRSAHGLVFGSEIKAVATALPNGLQVNKNGLLEFLSFQNYFGSNTLFSGVEIFPAGSIAKISLDSMSSSIRRYWEASYSQASLSEGEFRDRLDAVLRASVRRQMQADVPVNSFLSGGIDSSAIAALASDFDGRIKTFTCGFSTHNVTDSEKLFDERALAELISARLGSEHYETVLHADDFLARMHDWAWHAEEPRVGSSFPNFCVSGLASKFTKVCMSGTGGDELFAGYPWRYQLASQNAGWENFVSRYFSAWHRMMTVAEFQVLTAPLDPHQFDSFSIFEDRLNSARARVGDSEHPMVDAALIFELETFLHGLLIVEDKASMAHGLEVRVPLLDNELVDLAFSIPLSLKLTFPQSEVLGGYGSQGINVMPAFGNGKKILRDVLAKYVPPEVVMGRKQGFSPPFETWFRKDLFPWIDGEVFGKSSRLADFFDMAVARKIWNEHACGHKNHRLFVWGMVSLHLALKNFLGQIK